MKVNLYIVTNDVNDKVYIGQTSETLSKRWAKHINDAIKRDGNTNKFHNALITIGINHFSIKLIDQFDVSIIDEKEIEYIEKYDSFRNGYNSTLGGGLGLRIPPEIRKYAAELYIGGYSRVEIANEIGCGTSKVTDILLEYGIMPDFEKNTPIGIIMYDNKFNIQKLFNSKNEAYLYIHNMENPNCDKQGFYGHLKKAFDTGCIRYKHCWQLASDLVYKDKIFRTKFDKEAYIQGKPAYQPEGKQYWIVDGALDNIIKKYNSQSFCIDCGVKITVGATRCVECRYKAQSAPNNIKNAKICKQCKRIVYALSKDELCNSCSNVITKGKSQKPSKEQLEQLITKYNQKEIAEIYGRSRSTVNYWLKSYGII